MLVMAVVMFVVFCGALVATAIEHIENVASFVCRVVAFVRVAGAFSYRSKASGGRYGRTVSKDIVV